MLFRRVPDHSRTGAVRGSRNRRHPTENVRDYEALVANKPVVPLDENVSRRAGVLEGNHLVSDSKPNLGPTDAIVAATGLTYNEPVVTSDMDFQQVDGLQVETF